MNAKRVNISAKEKPEVVKVSEYKADVQSNKRTARFAGLWYFLFLITAPLGLMYIPTQIVIKTNAIETAKNILESESLFRIGILSTIIGQIIFIFLVLTLYKLFKEVNKKHAGIMVALVLVAVPIAILNEVFYVGALHLLKGTYYLESFESNQINTLALFLLNMREYGTLIAGFFWGLWLFPFGYLVIKSGFMPKVLGILLIVGCFAYLLDSSLALLVPEFRDSITDILFLPISIGEVSAIFYLLIKGVRQEKREPGTPIKGQIKN